MRSEIDMTSCITCSTSSTVMPSRSHSSVSRRSSVSISRLRRPAAARPAVAAWARSPARGPVPASSGGRSPGCTPACPGSRPSRRVRAGARRARARRRRDAAARRPWPRRARRCQQRVLAHRQRAEQLQVLEGARRPTPPFHAASRDVGAVEADAAAGGTVVARDAVEGGGLAGAVRADQRVDAAALDLDRPLIAVRPPNLTVRPCTSRWGAGSCGTPLLGLGGNHGGRRARAPWRPANSPWERTS